MVLRGGKRRAGKIMILFFIFFWAQLTPAATATSALPGTAAGGQGSTATTPREPANIFAKDMPPMAKLNIPTHFLTAFCICIF